MIYLTINGKEVRAQPGMTILEVADQNGIRIPRLCYHSSLSPIGACRLCVVEVKPGPPRPLPACTTPVADKMEVTTHSEKLDHYRREVLQLLLMNHPLDCPICDKGGECELQNLTQELKIKDQPYEAAKIPPAYDDRSPLIERYPDRCVNCERCVRICRDRVGAAALYFDNRGYRTTVTAGAKVMHCEHCGSCVAVCPTGSLTDKTFKYRARAWELEKQVAICPYCGGGCHIILNTKEDRLKRITSSFEEPVNGVLLCSRGRFSMDILEHPQRLTQPLVRKNGSLEPVSWEEAYDFVVDHARKIIEQYGPQAIAGVGSPRASNEANYLFQKLCRLAIGTPHIDSTSSLDHQRILRAFITMMGAPHMGLGTGLGEQKGRIQVISGFQLAVGTLEDLREADMVLILGACLKNEMVSLGWQINQAQQTGQLKQLCVINSDRFTRFRSKAQWSGSCRPGSSGHVLLGILKAFVALERASDEYFEKFKGKENLLDFLERMDWQQLEVITGLKTDDFQWVAKALEDAVKPSIVIGQALAGVVAGSTVSQYVADLLLVLGRKPRVHLIAEKANTQGCSDMGISPDWLPGYAPLDQADRFESVWKKTPPKTPGMDLWSIIGAAAEEGDHPIRGLFVLGSNLLPVLPDFQRTEKALKQLDLLVCQDVFLNETAAMAHCVFPALTSVETPGTLTSTELRVQKQQGKVFCPGPKPDWRIIQELSNRMGCAMQYDQAGDIFEEIRQVFPQYDQYPFEEIPKDGFFWNRLHLVRFGSATWKRKFDPTLEVKTPELPLPPRTSEQYPFLLHLGKSMFQSGTLSRYGRGSTELEREGRVWLHPDDAESLGVSDGEKVMLITESDRLSAPVQLDRHVAHGVVRSTTHFSDLEIQRLTRDGILTPVRVEKS